MTSLLKHGIWASVIGFFGWSAFQRLTLLILTGLFITYAPSVGGFVAQQVESRRVANLELAREQFKVEEQAKQQQHLRTLEETRVRQQFEKEKVEQNNAKTTAEAAKLKAQAEKLWRESQIEALKVLTARANALVESQKAKAEYPKVSEGCETTPATTCASSEDAYPVTGLNNPLRVKAEQRMERNALISFGKDAVAVCSDGQRHRYVVDVGGLNLYQAEKLRWSIGVAKCGGTPGYMSQQKLSADLWGTR